MFASRWLFGLPVCVCALAWSFSLPATLDSQARAAQSSDETQVYFDSSTVSELKLIIDQQGQQRLREVPREYTMCSMTEDSATNFPAIGVKLKGAAGSYRDFDDRPGLTVSMKKFKKGQRFHGMEKFHLNNASQDETFLCEWLGSELFRLAGYPAPRVGHVRLRINDRDMGLYVVREGFDEPFMKRAFGSNEGNLYDGGFLTDIDSQLETDMGDASNRQDLIGLALACHASDPAKRIAMIEERLDMDKFLRFMAIERLLGHWDGYTLNTNNYRVFFPAKGKAVFLPHGMDQLFGDPHAGLYDHSSPLLAAAVMQNDSLRSRYEKTLKSLSKLLQPVDVWHGRIDRQREKLSPLLTKIDPNLSNAHQDRINELKDRLQQRIEALPSLINDGTPQTLEVAAGEPILMTDWYPAVEAENIRLEERTIGRVPCLAIERDVFGDFSSSWRKQVLLKRGKYLLEARVKTEEVLPICDESGRGAGIRISRASRSNEVVSTSDWTRISYEINVVEDQKMVELILELRARIGKAWFDRESLKLTRE